MCITTTDCWCVDLKSQSITEYKSNDVSQIWSNQILNWIKSLMLLISMFRSYWLSAQLGQRLLLHRRIDTDIFLSILSFILNNNIGYPKLSYISLYFSKLYYSLYLSAYTIYSLDHPILKLYGKWQESTWIYSYFLLYCETFYEIK